MLTRIPVDEIEVILSLDPHGPKGRREEREKAPPGIRMAGGPRTGAGNPIHNNESKPETPRG